MVDGDSLIVSGEIGTDSMGLAGIFIFKMDTLGIIGSLKLFRDALAMDHLLLSGRNSMLKDHNGKIILGGVFLDQDDLLVLKLNNDFSQVFYESLNYMEGITATTCNSTYAVGYSYKSAGFYEGLILKVSGDGCIDTLCTTTAIEDQIHLEEDKVLLYPNPARDELTIQFSDEIPKNTFVSIYDPYGRELKSFHFYESKNILDLSGLPDGVYMLHISDTNHLIATGKFIKQE